MWILLYADLLTPGPMDSVLVSSLMWSMLAVHQMDDIGLLFPMVYKV